MIKSKREYGAFFQITDAGVSSDDMQSVAISSVVEYSCYALQLLSIRQSGNRWVMANDQSSFKESAFPLVFLYLKRSIGLFYALIIYAITWATVYPAIFIDILADGFLWALLAQCVLDIAYSVYGCRDETLKLGFVLGNVMDLCHSAVASLVTFILVLAQGSDAVLCIGSCEADEVSDTLTSLGLGFVAAVRILSMLTLGIASCIERDQCRSTRQIDTQDADVYRSLDKYECSMFCCGKIISCCKRSQDGPNPA